VVKGGKPVMAVGALGGRTIINTVLLAILNRVDFGMNLQEAIDAPRFHHQWLPDEIRFERHGLSPDTRALLQAKGHALRELAYQGVAAAVGLDPATGLIEGAADRRDRDAAAVGR
jgi:gamma-glutamyltranspeptidase/glutathione hydrolase